ncbi:hypothetical protein K461DRAFT_160046 [Myriangium duriaei CBS 260.36]|uniref:Uncharacterized protein n=1 Tax=Myriangium duriaei CBS 260.36 TaxID=1168546 RepID=A0A9P4J0A9_9PEZI|nr:hypothetical protein K461DRAFT_160046 [Myriangium duriaei CBS 260.36]
MPTMQSASPDASTSGEAPMLLDAPPSIPAPTIRKSWPTESPQRGGANKPFKLPRSTNKGPERDAWFHIPQMRRDERARQKAKGVTEKQIRPTMVFSGDTIESDDDNTDIRSFMKPRLMDQAQTRHVVGEVQPEWVVELKRSLVSKVAEKENAADMPMSLSHLEESKSRSPLVETDANRSTSPQYECITNRTKSNGMRRMKSSMLPLERTPNDQHTQNLTTEFLSAPLVRSQFRYAQGDAAHLFDIPEGHYVRLPQPPDIKETLSDHDIAMAVEVLCPMLSQFAGRTIELAPGFADQIALSLTSEEEMLL